ncbi:MAG TPA: ANTAR domain-containing protein [Actinomycetes bacterium]|nr:ANTAR domain-containing protein [Actinomycetes bacterium]
MPIDPDAPASSISGMAMEREGLDPGAAFQRIRRRARSNRERAIDVARRLVDGGPLDPPAS